uniref:Uncharacterized protein n=1 Tax=uncultured Armatimonadetes bacterium TaxID=157466 RepID=A0A6J4JQZ8_9BACT|nr:hypothetical protein AVDCRST_MAG63-3863 [uncultured Armatimonadetes bacterium]
MGASRHGNGNKRSKGGPPPPPPPCLVLVESLPGHLGLLLRRGWVSVAFAAAAGGLLALMGVKSSFLGGFLMVLPVCVLPPVMRRRVLAFSAAGDIAWGFSRSYSFRHAPPPAASPPPACEAVGVLMRRGEVGGWRVERREGGRRPRLRVHGFGGREIEFDFICAAGELPDIERRIAGCLGYNPSGPAPTAGATETGSTAPVS